MTCQGGGYLVVAMAGNDLGRNHGIPDDILDGIFAESEIQNRGALNTRKYEDTKADDAKPDKNVCQTSEEKKQETKIRTTDETIGNATGTEENMNSKNYSNKQ